MPVVRCVSVKIIKGEYGDSFEPVFVIETWVDRSRVPQLTAAIAADLQSVRPAPGPDTGMAIASPSPLSVRPPAMAQSGNSQPAGPGERAVVEAQRAVDPPPPPPAVELDDEIPF